MLGRGCCLIADSFYMSSQPTDTLIFSTMSMYCAVKVTREYLIPAVKIKKLKKGAIVAFHWDKLWMDDS
jgi:hypothetical protein